MSKNATMPRPKILAVLAILPEFRHKASVIQLLTQDRQPGGLDIFHARPPGNGHWELRRSCVTTMRTELDA